MEAYLANLNLVDPNCFRCHGIVTAPPLGAHFPQKIKTSSAHLSAVVKGELTLENGCLRVSGVKNAVHGDGFLLIWEPIFSTRTEQGVVQVIDSTGKVLASVGDFIELDGGSAPTGMWLKQPIPDECHGPYWLVGASIKKIDRP